MANRTAPPLTPEFLETAATQVAAVREKIGDLRFYADMPDECMYGYLGQIAESAGSYNGWGYLSALAVSAGRYSLDMCPSNSVRAQIYAVLCGRVNDGKTTTSKRIRETINPDRIGIESRVPGSDIGLFRFFALPKGVEPPGETESRLLFQDEIATLLQKMQIGGSSLESVLRELFYDDIGGGASKAGDYFMNIRLSILGSLPATTPADFRDAFGYSTNGGLFDRTLICPGPSYPIDLDDHFTWRSTMPVRVAAPVSLDGDSQGPFKAWQRAAATDHIERRRRRLQELAARVAVISASMNGETYLSTKCIDAALCFIDWQERAREGGFKPSSAKSIEGAIFEDFIETMRSVTCNERGMMVNFPQLNRDKRWSATYGSGKMLQLRDAMVKLGELIPEVRDSSLPPTGRNLTGNYMLGRHFFPKVEKVKVPKVEEHYEDDYVDPDDE